MRRSAWPGRSRPCLRPALALSVWAGLAVSAGAQGTAPTPEQIDDGRKVYDEFCLTCHGRDMVSPGLVTFDLRRFPKDDAERFRNAVLNGKGPAMPPWRDKLSNEEVELLWAYVRGGP